MGYQKFFNKLTEVKKTFQHVFDEAERKGLETFGVRSDERKRRIGEVLPKSQIYDEGEPTGEYLDGTSATQVEYLYQLGTGAKGEGIDALVKKAFSYNKKTYMGKYWYLLGAPYAQGGEDINEIVMEKAVVLAEFKSDGTLK